MDAPSHRASLRIFLSYAAEQLPLAEQIYQRLKNLGHRVFFDRTSLHPGEGYDAAILEELRSSDLMVFLISPRSIEEGAYARTELRYAQDIWKNPEGHVLPVMAVEIEFSMVPAYLSAITILRPEGNIPAEVVAKVTDLASGWKQGDTVTGQLRQLQSLVELNQQLSKLDQQWKDTQAQYQAQPTSIPSSSVSPEVAASIPLLFAIILSVSAFIGDSFFVEARILGAVVCTIGAILLYLRASDYEDAKVKYLVERDALIDTINDVRTGKARGDAQLQDTSEEPRLFRHL